MAKYGITIYRTDVYGPDPGLDFSVSPIELTVLDFNVVEVVWRQSSGVYTGARLVRNQTSYPETVDDGELVWSQESPNGESPIQLSRNVLVDGRDNPNNVELVPGKLVFYKMFLFNAAAQLWVSAGQAFTLIPANHQLHKTIMEWIPRIYTSADQNPIGIIEPNTDIYKFLGGIAFTAEELLTYIDLLQPSISQDRFTHLPRLRLERDSLGLIRETTLPIKNQRTLVREARRLYATKGTKLGIAAYVEALTGFSPTITVEPNLLLSNQDSTFYQTTGNWEATNATLASTNDAAHDSESIFTLETRAIDRNNYCTATVSSTPSTMSLGFNGSDVGEKIPVTPGVFYNFTAYVKTESGKSVTPTITFYDQNGVAINTVLGTTTTNISWSQILMENLYAPKDVTQSILLAYADGSSINYATSIPAEVTVGSTVNISGFTNTAFNKTNAIVTEITEDGFAVASTMDTDFEAPTNAIVETAYQGQDAVYAGISLSFSAAGTYKIDMVCLQPKTSSRYSEARAVDILLQPNKTNYIKNPSFEDLQNSDVSTNWTVSGGTLSADSYVPPVINTGNYSAKVISTGSWTLRSNTVPIVTGEYWTASAYVHSENGSVTMKLIRRDSAGTIIHTEQIEMQASIIWKRVILTDIVDCNCTSATIEVEFSGSHSPVFIDAVQLERSFRASEYFDGTYPYASGAEWEGAPKVSYSNLYPGKPLKIQRLVSTIQDWLPRHLWWRISTKAGLEKVTEIE